MQRVKSVSRQSFLIPAVFAAALAFSLPSSLVFACEHDGCSAEHKEKDCGDCTKENCKCKGCKDGKCKHDHAHKHAEKKAKPAAEKTEEAAH